MQGEDVTREIKPVFWKKLDKSVPGSIKPVYGASHPPRTESPRSSPKKENSKPNHKRNSSATSFQDFQESTDDAWDAGDDDFCFFSDVAKSTALTVLNNHRQCPKDFENADSSNDGQTEATQRLATHTESFSSPNHKVPMGGKHGPGLALRQTPHAHYPRPSPTRYLPSPIGQPEREIAKVDKFHSLLQTSNIDLNELRQLTWSGVPRETRATAWRLLSGYLPPNAERRDSTLSRKREEYFNFVTQYYNTRNEDIHQETYRQIHIDIPRMSPLIPIFQQEVVQKIFERILYIWAIRHPASGYVQGMNDLVTPFFVVFLQEFVDKDVEIESVQVAQLPEDALQIMEADSYWCMSKLLDGIQNNYTFAQPGIQIKVNQLKELIGRINAPLHDHLMKHHVEYLQFSFRWMNNLLMRELPLHCTIRLWDTYQAEPDGFACFHLYVCAAFLNFWSKELLRERDFQGLMLHLQNLPTQHWGNEEISLLVAEAYRLKYMFADAPNHLNQSKIKPIV